MSDWTPTTEQVRYGFAVDPEAEYRDPLTNHTLHGERAFDRWLAAHDAEVWDKGRDAAVSAMSRAGIEVYPGYNVTFDPNPYRTTS